MKSSKTEPSTNPAEVTQLGLEPVKASQKSWFTLVHLNGICYVERCTIFGSHRKWVANVMWHTKLFLRRRKKKNIIRGWKCVGKHFWPTKLILYDLSIGGGRVHLWLEPGSSYNQWCLYVAALWWVVPVISGCMNILRGHSYAKKIK